MGLVCQGLQVPVEEICRHLGLRFTTDGSWLSTKGLLVAMHPTMACIAVACRNEVAVFQLLCPPTTAQPPPSAHAHSTTLHHTTSNRSTGGVATGGRSSQPGMLSEERGSLLGCAMTEESDITCITWVSVTPPRQQLPTAPLGSVVDAQSATELGSEGIVNSDSSEHVALLVVGDGLGYLQVHDWTGRALIRQRLHVGALRELRWRPLYMGTCLGSDECEELTVLGSGCILQIQGYQFWTVWQKCEGLRVQRQAKQSAFASVLGWGVGSSPAEQVSPLQCQRWDLPRSLHSHTHAICTGHQPPDLYSVLRGAASGPPHPSIVLLGGVSLASIELRKSGSRSTLGAAFGAATSLASDVISMARNAGGTVVGGPAAITRGLKNFVLAPLFSTPVLGARQGEPPFVIHPDPSSGTPPPQVTPVVLAALQDSPRVVTGLFPAPKRCFVATTDNLGRVMLMDGARMMAIRMWKGYRDAQCGWLEVPHKYCTPKRVTSIIPGPATYLPSAPLAGSSIPSSEHRGISDLTPSASDADQQPYQSMHDEIHLPQPPTQPTEIMQQRNAGVANTQQQVKLSQADDETVLHGLQGDCVSSCCLVLVLYAPRRQVVEFYPVPHGGCMGVLPAGPHCQLLAVNGQGLGGGGLHCCLLNPVAGRVRDLRHELIACYQ